MTRSRTMAVGLSLTFCLTAPGVPAWAQAPGLQQGGGEAGTTGAPGGVNLIIILMAPAVQQELKLTDSQKTQLFELTRDASRKSRDIMQSVFQNGGANPQALMMAGLQVRQENERAIAKILQPEQKERADQIILRVEGPVAVARPEISSKLNLTPTQSQQIQATLFQMMLAQREFFMANRAATANAGGVPNLNQGAMMRHQMNQLREASGQQIGRILNGKQKAAFNKMLGEPFDISQIDPDLPRPAPAAAAGSAPADTRTPTPEKTPAQSKESRGRQEGCRC